MSGMLPANFKYCTWSTPSTNTTTSTSAATSTSPLKRPVWSEVTSQNSVVINQNAAEISYDGNLKNVNIVELNEAGTLNNQAQAEPQVYQGFFAVDQLNQNTDSTNPFSQQFNRGVDENRRILYTELKSKTLEDIRNLSDADLLRFNQMAGNFFVNENGEFLRQPTEEEVAKGQTEWIKITDPKELAIRKELLSRLGYTNHAASAAFNKYQMENNRVPDEQREYNLTNSEDPTHSEIATSLNIFADNMFADYDANFDGELSFDEVLKNELEDCPELDKDYVKNYFDSLDSDGNGKINQEEMRDFVAYVDTLDNSGDSDSLSKIQDENTVYDDIDGKITSGSMKLAGIDFTQADKIQDNREKLKGMRVLRERLAADYSRQKEIALLDTNETRRFEAMTEEEKEKFLSEASEEDLARALGITLDGDESLAEVSKELLETFKELLEEEKKEEK